MYIFFILFDHHVLCELAFFTFICIVRVPDTALHVMLNFFVKQKALHLSTSLLHLYFFDVLSATPTSMCVF